VRVRRVVEARRKLSRRLDGRKKSVAIPTSTVIFIPSSKGSKLLKLIKDLAANRIQSQDDGSWKLEGSNRRTCLVQT
jgi:hypothetical protein